MDSLVKGFAFFVFVVQPVAGGSDAVVGEFEGGGFLLFIGSGIKTERTGPYGGFQRVRNFAISFYFFQLIVHALIAAGKGGFVIVGYMVEGISFNHNITENSLAQKKNLFKGR